MVDKVAFEFDPFELVGKDRPTGNVSAAKEEIKQFILDSVLEHMEAGRSPVAGGEWKRTLSAAYKKRTGKTIADLELTGALKDALEVVSKGKNLEIRVQGKEADKADGHTNHTGRSRLPPREFIPKDGQTFKRTILRGIKDIIDEWST